MATDMVTQAANRKIIFRIIVWFFGIQILANRPWSTILADCPWSPGTILYD